MNKLFQYNGKEWVEIAKNGKDGKTPIAGIDFPLPENGKTGPRGPKGNAGSPDTAEDIVQKISSLKDEARLSYETLKDVPNIESYIQRIKISSRDYDLSELKDVSIGSQTNGQALVWDSTLGKWKAGTAGTSSPLTTKGDIYTYSTADARLPVGTNGYILSADSGETTGLKWIPNASATAWSITGNAGLTAGTNFLGTTDAVDVVFKRNSVETLRIIENGLTLNASGGTFTINSDSDIQITANNASSNINLSSKNFAFSGSHTASQAAFSVANFYLQTPGSSVVPVLNFADDTANRYVAFKSPTGLAGTTTYTLPAAYPGGNGYALTSTTAGVMSWSAISSGLTVGTTTITSGTTTKILYDNAGVLGEYGIGTGIAISGGNLTVDGTTSTVLLNNILAATTTNTINNANYNQEWQWNTLAGSTGLKLSSTSTAAATNTQKVFEIALSGANGTSTQTTYGSYVTNTHTGTTSTNVAGYFSANGGTSVNYSLLTQNGIVLINQAFHYNTGTSSPAGSLFTVQPGEPLNGSWASGVELYTSKFGGTNKYRSGGSSALQRENIFVQSAIGGTGSAASFTDAATVAIEGATRNQSAAGITNTHALLISATQSVNASAAPTNSYGLTVNTQTGAINNYAAQFLGGNVGIGTSAPTAALHLTEASGSGTQLPLLRATGAAHTALTASTEHTEVIFDLRSTKQFATGAWATQRAMLIQAPTYGFVGASTITSAATVSISGAPIAGTNATITRSWALSVASGNTQLAGNAFIGASGIAPTAYLHLAAGTASASTAPLKFTSGTLNTTAESGAMEFLAEKFTLTPTSTARMSVMGVLFTQTADKNISNTVTETTLLGTGVSVGGGLTLPANFFVEGKTLKIHVHGYHSSTGNPNITLKIKLGSVVVCQGTGVSGNGSTDGFYLDSEITCRTTGATGTVSAAAQYDEVHNTGLSLGIVQTGTTTIDTTSSQVLDVTITWGTADAGNTITSQIAYIEVLN